MADEEQVVQPVEALQNAITDPVAQDAVGDALTHINNHLQMAEIADANTAAGQNLEDDWTRFGGGMIQWVKNDPTAVHAAMDAVVPMARGVVDSVPGVENPDDHHANLVNDLQRQIAISAVKGAADQHAGLAADLLGQDRIKDVLGDDTHKQLVGYAYAQADARQRDASSQAIERAQAAQDASTSRLVDYASALEDPTGRGPRFPDRWNQRVLSDPAVRPQHQGLLGDLYYTMRTRGDVPSSDGLTAASMINAVANGTATPDEILGHAVAGNLRLQDAVHLAKLARDDGTGPDDHAQGLAQLAYAGRTAIMGRDGENGAAGVAAFDRYMNWLLPQYRRTGAAGAVPGGDFYLLNGGIRAFMPTGDDLPAPRGNREKSLGQIFAQMDDTRNPNTQYTLQPPSPSDTIQSEAAS